MTRLELLTIVVGRARTNGFEFRRWYTTRLELPWISAKAALQLLDEQRRYYALLFSHEIANAFWKAGEDNTFAVPSQSFQRPMPDGTLKTVKRKSFIRRSSRHDAWRYHLREMALAEEPLRYLRKYLNVEEDLNDLSADSPATIPHPRRTVATKPAKAAPKGRPLPTDTPAFLRRPYEP
jgi:hypothetical protein